MELIAVYLEKHKKKEPMFAEFLRDNARLMPYQKELIKHTRSGALSPMSMRWARQSGKSDMQWAHFEHAAAHARSSGVMISDELVSHLNDPVSQAVSEIQQRAVQRMLERLNESLLESIRGGMSDIVSGAGR